MNEDYEELYSEGYCHVFALAVNEIFGGSFLLIEDYEHPFQQPDNEGDDGVPNIVHVYAVADFPEGPVAIDVFGKRPVDDAVAEAKARYDVEELDATLIANSDALHALISEYSDRDGQKQYIDRPLDGYFPDDVTNAKTLLLNAAPVPAADPPCHLPALA